jgi:hypothetical protein
MVRWLTGLLALLAAPFAAAQLPLDTARLVQPAEGMWWSPDMPGTGVAFNVDDQGRWFAAIYLYTDDGAPTFLTMQGEAVAYDVSPYGTAEPVRPYAVAASPLIHSEGGQCLQCPWTPASAAVTDTEAVLEFFNPVRGQLRVGDWVLPLVPLPTPGAMQPGPDCRMGRDGQFFAVIVQSGDERHTAVVRYGESGFTGARFGSLHCVDCRTVDANGTASDDADQALKQLLEREVFFSQLVGRCRMGVTGNANLHLFGDKQGRTISGVWPRPGEPGEPVQFDRITLIRLPDDWR